MDNDKSSISSAAQMAVEAYLQNWTPASDGDQETEIVLKTTDSIVRDLSDMVDLDENEVADQLISHGYKMLFLANGRHGWALRRR